MKAKMTRLKWPPAIALLGIALAIMVSACGSDTAATAGGSSSAASGGNGDGEDSITIAVYQPTTLNAEVSESGTMLDNIYQSLFEWSPKDQDKLEPVLATDLPKRVDATTWRVDLRKGVKFTNGEPFNAEAAALSINHFIDPKTGAGNASELEGVEKATAVGPYTIEITTEKPDPILPNRLTLVYMVPPKYALTKAFTNHPIGTGPYEFVDYEPGQYLEVTRNPDYWGPKPPIENAKFDFITDNQAMVSALSTGQVQLAYNVSATSKDAVPKYIVEQGDNNAYLRLKTYEGPLEDEKLRQAISYAVDPASYAENIYRGTAKPLDCQLQDSTVFGYDPNLEPHPHDIEKAAQLVKESGYDGTPLTISAPTDWQPLVSPVIQSINASLNEIGIKTKVKLTTRDVWGEEFLIPLHKGQPDIAFSASSTELHDADKLSADVGSKGSLSSDPSPQLTNELDAARVQLDPTKRQAEYDTIDEQICNEAHLVPLYQFDNAWGAASNLQWTPQVDGAARVWEMSFQ